VEGIDGSKRRQPRNMLLSGSCEEKERDSKILEMRKRTEIKGNIKRRMS
jgi:hypothetical protein